MFPAPRSFGKHGIDISRGKKEADHLSELGILHHHRMNDAEEAFIGRENTNAAGQGITLQESLTHVFAKDFNYSAAAGVGELVPLEIAVCAFISIPENSSRINRTDAIFLIVFFITSLL